MMFPAWTVSVWYNHSLTSISCRTERPVRSSTGSDNETFLTTACSIHFPSPYISRLLVHLVPLVAKTENSLLLSPLVAGNIVPPRLCMYKGRYMHLAWIHELLPRSVIKSSLLIFILEEKFLNWSCSWSRMVCATSRCSWQLQGPDASPSETSGLVLSYALSDMHCPAWTEKTALLLPPQRRSHVATGDLQKTLLQQLLPLCFPPQMVWQALW